MNHFIYEKAKFILIFKHIYFIRNTRQHHIKLKNKKSVFKCMQLLFPFDNIRKVQSDMIKDLENVIDKKKHLIAHAPTGLGKTAATISVALTYAIKKDKNVFFLTSRHTQHHIVIETLRKIKEKHGQKIISTDFVGKKWMCSVPEIKSLSSKDFSEYCHDIKNDGRCEYYNKIKNNKKFTKEAKEFIKELKNKSPMHVEEVINESSKEKFCPYYISSELAKDSKVIIADYYHVFHPSIRDAFFSRIKKEIEDSIIIIDEAQNLPKRIRNVLSSKISTFSLRSAIREADKFDYPEMADEIEYLLDMLNNMKLKLLKNKNEAYIRKEDFIDFINDNIRNYDEFSGDLILIGEKIRNENKRSFVGSIGSFLSNWSEAEKGYIGILRKTKWKRNEQIELDLSCLDPGVASKDIFEKCHSAILMSGTLTPTRMYRDIMSMDEKRTLCKEYKNPFLEKNRLSLIIPDTTTKYTRRSEKEFKKMADWCDSITRTIPGNVAVFFPSYKLRDEVTKYFENKTNKKIFMEERGMNKKEKANFLEKFKKNSEDGAVFMGVVSGNFSEGVDLPGKFLNGVIVVGIPLGRPNLETKALIDYYDQLFGTGWNYGYVYPAINKVVQACGRVIRSDTDRGVIALLDERFTWKNYFNFLPSDWNLIVTKEPKRRIKNFFKS